MNLKELLERANNGIIGIDDKLCVYSGYDQSVMEADAVRVEWLNDDDYPEMSKEDKIALADRMIDLWSEYKQTVINQEQLLLNKKVMGLLSQYKSAVSDE